MSQLRVFVDRIEGNMAVLLTEEDGQQLILPVRLLPNKCAEGDVIDITFEINKEAAKKAKQEVQNLIDELSGDDNKTI